MIPYPDNLPCASRIEGHSATIFAGLIRTPMEAGNTRQRRSHRVIPHLISLAFVSHQNNYAEWLDWVNAHAWDEWVEMELPGLHAGRAATDLAPIMVRFCSDIRAELLPVHRLWYWRAVVDCEWAPSAVGIVPEPDECATFDGPFLLRDEFDGAAAGLASYVHDVNTVGAPSWSVSGAIATDGAGHLILPPDSTASMTLALTYPKRIGLRINAATSTGDPNVKAIGFSLNAGIEGSILGSVVELYFPFTELAGQATFNWDYAVGREMILEYVEAGAESFVRVYICGEFIGAIAAFSGSSSQMGPMTFFKISRPPWAVGDVYLDYIWLD